LLNNVIPLKGCLIEAGSCLQGTTAKSRNESGIMC
jgi:hypothetical protein